MYVGGVGNCNLQTASTMSAVATMNVTRHCLDERVDQSTITTVFSWRRNGVGSGSGSRRIRLRRVAAGGDGLYRQVGLSIRVVRLTLVQ